MPRGRGGPRQGAPGKAYPDRMDLTSAPPASAPPASGQAPRPYGQPQPQMPPPNPNQGPGAAPAPPPQGGGAGPQPAPEWNPPHLPGQLGPLERPTERPNEHVMTGAPIGGGPGREALTAPGAAEPTEAALRAMYSKFPSPEIQQLISYQANKNMRGPAAMAQGAQVAG